MNKKQLQDQLMRASEALNAFDWPRASEIYAAVLKEHPENAGALLGVGILMNRSGKHMEALELLKRIWVGIQKAPAAEKAQVPAMTKAEVLAQMALALQLLQQDEQAIKLYEAAHELYASPQIQQRVAALRNPRTES